MFAYTTTNNNIYALIALVHSAALCELWHHSEGETDF